MPSVIFKIPREKLDQRAPIELIIFDCDGVLIDSEILGNQVIHQELISLGHALTLEEYLEIGVGRRKEEEEAILKEKGIALPIDFWENTSIKILNAFTKHLQPIQGIKEVLDQLNLKKCIASSSSRQRLELSLAVTALETYFHGLIFDGGMVKNGKPSPDIFQLAAQTLGVAPSKCLVIEDSVPGIQAALAARMRVWGFIGGKHCSPSYTKAIHEMEVELTFQEMKDLPKLLHSPLFV
jgi:HAD superfamily hydrolase (TIGR01509 family)